MYNLYLERKGIKPELIGCRLSANQVVQFSKNLPETTSVVEYNYYDEPLAIANPKVKIRKEEYRRIIEDCEKSPVKAFEQNAKPTKTAMGKSKSISYPIRLLEVQNTSIVEAVFHCALMLQTKAAADIVRKSGLVDPEATRIHIPEKDILSALSQSDIIKLAEEVKGSILKSNAKMRKNKIPASLGFGEPSEYARYNEIVIPELSDGISFMPHEAFMGRSDDDESSYFNTILAIDTSDASPSQKLIIEAKKAIIRNIEYSGRSSCPRADVCKEPCLSYSNNRYATSKDTLGRSIENREKRFAEYANWVSLGNTQAMFFANPYYFFRVLISALEDKLCFYDKYICEQVTSGAFSSAEAARFREAIPPAVRLNVLSDYVWELIFPELFDLYSGKKGKRPYIQFYDYTKIAGRWKSSVREELYPLSTVEYRLPENYNITFSYSGTIRSAKESEVCMEYGRQSASFVFYAMNLASFDKKSNNAIKQLFPEAELSGVADKIIDALSAAKIPLPQGAMLEKFEDIRPQSLNSALPDYFVEYNGYTVANGEITDARFLDKHIDGDKPYAVGLCWTQPRKYSIKVGGKNTIITPLTAASDIVDLAESAAAAAETARASARFAVPLVYLGVEAIGVRFFITLSGYEPQGDFTIRTLPDTDITKLGLDVLSTIDWNTTVATCAGTASNSDQDDTFTVDRFIRIMQHEFERTILSSDS